MPSLFSKALNGVSVKHCKNTANSAAVRMPVPDKVVIPMIQHMGAPCEPLVKVKDTVTVGQLLGDTDAFLSAPIHSSVSGTVTAIDFRHRGVYHPRRRQVQKRRHYHR